MEVLIGASALLLIGGTYWLYRKFKKSPVVSETAEPSARPVSAPLTAVPPEEAREAVRETEKKPTLRDRLSQTRGQLTKSFGSLFTKTASFDPKEWDSVEEALLTGDVGIKTAQLLMERVKEKGKRDPHALLKDLLRQECGELLLEATDVSPTPSEPPRVIMVVGVNGVGKTTTVGKLAKRFASEGKKILLGAADTFRAGAISQLKVWAERTGAQFVAGAEGGDPGAVAFDAISAAKARKMDVLLLDTAGRLHTKANLMEELKKVQRVLKKVIPDAPHETWLVLDGTLGQNSLRQAQEFHSALNLTGFIVTKLDGTAKGGTILSLAHEFKLPIHFIGVGEAAEDLVPFAPQEFVNAIIG